MISMFRIDNPGFIENSLFSTLISIFVKFTQNRLISAKIVKVHLCNKTSSYKFWYIRVIL